MVLANASPWLVANGTSGRPYWAATWPWWWLTTCLLVRQGWPVEADRVGDSTAPAGSLVCGVERGGRADVQLAPTALSEGWREFGLVTPVLRPPARRGEADPGRTPARDRPCLDVGPEHLRHRVHRVRHPRQPVTSSRRARGR